MKTVMAIDIGASSGRAIVGVYDGQKISLKEVHRFENVPVIMQDTFYWDILRLFHEIKTGIRLACHEAEADEKIISSLGIDTWGVDFGLLDENGKLLQNPVHYRDRRTAGIMPEVWERIGKNHLYQVTGIQFMEFNTIFQLYALSKQEPELLAIAKEALLMPDLLGYLLTGKKTAEYAIASTTQLMDARTKTWRTDIMENLGIPSGLFPPITSSGGILGPVSADIKDELALKHAPDVISVTGHDTACAVAAVPTSDDNDFIYISCGTWSLFGTELDAPVINDKSFEHDITNEGGYGNTTRFLKNIIGLWLIQETRRQYGREGTKYSYNDLEKLALKAKPFRYFIDPDSPEFGIPGDIPSRIQEFCEKTGQGTPGSVGEIIRCIYESLALKYRHVFSQIKDCTGKTYRHIHMIGGGTKDGLLCDMTAAATGCPVIAGPVEATALGNIAVQLISLGEIKDLAEARKIIAQSVEPIRFEPQNTEQWDRAYNSFVKYLN